MSSFNKEDNEFGSLDQLYQEVILDHYRTPRNKESISEADAQIEHENPFCGDQMRMRVEMDGGRVAVVKFDGKGCAISQASASMMSELMANKPVADVERMIDEFKAFMRSENELGDEFGDLIVLEGVQKFPVRIKCALLGWNALNACIASASPLDVDASS